MSGGSKHDKLWQLNELASAVNGVIEVGETGAPVEGIETVIIDSREAADDAIFIAVKGVHSDGHQYVGRACEAGVPICLVHQDYQFYDDPENEGRPAPSLIRVPDTMAALKCLGKASRLRAKLAKTIAITGSAGKTSTKNMAAYIFSKLGKTHSSVKSYNNQWGVPLSLARMSRDTNWGIFEVGMNHAGEITPLSKLISPHLAIITTVAPVHIGHFKSEEGIAKAKAEIFSGVVPGGFVLLPEDNHHFPLLRQMAAQYTDLQNYSFGTGGADIKLKNVRKKKTGLDVEASLFGQNVSYSLSMQGIHHVMNSLAVLGAVRLLEGDVELAASAMQDIHETAGRGQRTIVPIQEGAFTLIDESYNANPLSVSIALENLGQSGASSRKIAVLGDMLELGDNAKSYHENLASHIEKHKIDLVFTVGPQMHYLHENLDPSVGVFHGEKASDILTPLLSVLNPGDFLMVKGSFSMGMNEIVSGIKQAYLIEETV